MQHSRLCTNAVCKVWVRVALLRGWGFLQAWARSNPDPDLDQVGTLLGAVVAEGVVPLQRVAQHMMEARPMDGDEPDEFGESLLESGDALAVLGGLAAQVCFLSTTYQLAYVPSHYAYNRARVHSSAAAGQEHHCYQVDQSACRGAERSHGLCL